MDFCKAFDTVPHDHFFIKLEVYGIRGKLLQWIKSFLTNRHQKVVLNGVSSNWSTVYSGVPQGSVLGPLFFNVYVNDIPSIIDSQTLIFADDTKIYREVKSKADSLQFQEDINHLFDWSTQWQLKFNISKCHILHLGPSHSYGDYHLDGNKITTESCVRDLIGSYYRQLLEVSQSYHLTITKANHIWGLSAEYFNT